MKGTDNMQNFQILSACNSTLGTCCNDYGLVTLLDIIRNAFNLIQLIVPIILLVMIIFQLIKLMVNPEEKNGMKKIINKVIATVFCFFLPLLVDLIIGLMPQTFTVSACWDNAKILHETSKNTPTVHVDTSKKQPTSFLAEQADLKGVEGTTASGTGGQKVVNIAAGEIGNNEGNDSHGKYEDFTGLAYYQPWCAAFVSWVAGQAGYLNSGVLPNFTYVPTGAQFFQSRGQLKYEGSGYNPKAGDIIFFGDSCGQHTGIVESSDADYVYTIEGNTSCEGEAASFCNGTDGVSRKQRSRHTGYICGYGTPSY